MKTLRTLLVIAVAIFGSSLISFGQTKTVVAVASANVVKTLTIENTTPLTFGTFGALADGPSTVILATNDGRTGTAGIVGADGKAGQFKITGEPGTTVAITVPGAASLTGPGSAMTIASNAWTYSISGLSSVTLAPVTGIATFSVGATLAVGTAQTPGAYSGNYTITVNYN